MGFFADGVRTVRSGLPKLLTGRDLSGFEDRRDSYLDLGVPLDLAERVAAMVPTYSAFDIVQVAASAGRGIEETAEVYFDLADRLQITLAAGPDHRAAAGGPLVHDGPGRPALGPLRRARLAHAGRARGQRT